MNIIAAVDKNWAIGKNNELLVRIPMDQKFFRETTTGNVGEFSEWSSVEKPHQYCVDT